MKAAYIGILSAGSTSRMRAETLKSLTPGMDWRWIDTDGPFKLSSRLWRTLAFRAKRGAAVERINRGVLDALRGESFDLVWIDKAVFLDEGTVHSVRSAAARMVHYTPDTAFHENRSRHFEKTLQMYDLLVTTKSFEMNDYRNRVSGDVVLLTTQGYDPAVHFPRNTADERRREVAFVGLAEPDRERCIALLLDSDIPVRLAGIGWNRFLRRWRNHPQLTFEGEMVFGDAYATLLSRPWIGLGLVSKRFPELHTTRTFEIPACGAVLATEATSDTVEFFDDGEAIFFNDYDDLATRLKSALHDRDDAHLIDLANAGQRRVRSDKRDYPSILGAVLSHPRLTGGSVRTARR